jgi:hypothetical protein
MEGRAVISDRAHICEFAAHTNLTITVLDIIHRPVFYLKLNSIGCPYLTGNTLILRYEPNRLILSLGL